MLSPDRAKEWFFQIKENHEYGNYEQKVLGLRRIFDGVLLEMFSDISEQAFYYTAVERIFESTKCNNYPTSDIKKLKREFHTLRKYLNNVQHSKVEADIKGYRCALRTLSTMINFCVSSAVPSTLIPSTKASNTSNSHKTIIDSNQNNLSSSKLTLIIIISRDNVVSPTQLYDIEGGIEFLKQHLEKIIKRFIVISINDCELLLSLPFRNSKHKFSLNNNNEVLSLRPLKNLIDSTKTSNIIVFYISTTNPRYNFTIPKFLTKTAEISMSIGIINKQSTLSDVSSSFDKLINEDNLPNFFNWVVKLIENN